MSADSSIKGCYGLRRLNGDLESHRRPSGPRILLPAEIELCETVGITPQEYFYFVDLVEAHNGERAKEYELVPDVQNNALTIAIISLVIGIASSAVSLLLAPKPRSPEQKSPPSLRTADVIGRSRYAPLVGFDSVQELATLGSVIPLVFSRKGVRVNGQLLWSQMLSEGTYQQLKAIFLFSSGKVEQRPDFEGYAIGDSPLSGYNKAKIALFFEENGGRLHAPFDLYPEGTLPPTPNYDVFQTFSDVIAPGAPTSQFAPQFRPNFCGTRTPSTQTQFGVYSPMPNGTMYRVNYELVLKPNDADDQIQDDIDEKRRKIGTNFPRLAGIESRTGNTVVYRIDWNNIEAVMGRDFDPWGIEDVASALDSGRVNIDNAISLGEQYLIGDALAIASNVPQQKPWELGYNKKFEFEILEEGKGRVDAIGENGFSKADPPWGRGLVQRVAIATVKNSRRCTATELGIKSVVYRQINGFPNVNSEPSRGTIRSYEEKGGSIQLGNVQKYVKRLSFFYLQFRKIGSTEWLFVTETPFCVKGNTPQPQYNYIRVTHPEQEQYEFRFRPLAGTVALQFYLRKEVFLLELGTNVPYQYNSSHNVGVRFSGRKLLLTDYELSNSEFVKGSPPRTSGVVAGFSESRKGEIPQQTVWVLDSTRYSKDSSVYDMDSKTQLWKWGGKTLHYGNPVTSITIENTRYVKGSAKGFSNYEIKREFLETQDVAPIAQTVVNPTGGSGTGLQVRVKTYANGYTWEVTTSGGGRNYTDGDKVTIPTANVVVQVKTVDAAYISNSLNSYDAISDFAVYDVENSSHFNEPEHSVVYVNEIDSSPKTLGAQYDRLAIAGIQINSSKEWANFSQFSAYFKKGIVMRRLVNNVNEATNLFPEIAYALLTDNVIGAGKLIGTEQVDRDRMTTAAKFCQAEGFTWDGVISERQNLREFIYEQAAYCLLDFSILGGRFSLYPSVPFSENSGILLNGKPEIKALFTDGNIRNLQVSFLSPEERQLFKAVCLWREETENGFPETRVYAARFDDPFGGNPHDPVETFDMTQFCTSEDHARKFALFALKTRREVDHGVKFETTPQNAMSLMPGEYFRLVSEATHTTRFDNGSVSADGRIITFDGLDDGSRSVYFWKPGTTDVQVGTLTVSGGKTNQSSFYGTVFTIKNSITTDRVYKVESLTYAEDGLVEIAGSHVPLTSDGTLEVLNWSPSQFKEEFS